LNFKNFENSIFKFYFLIVISNLWKMQTQCHAKTKAGSGPRCGKNAEYGNYCKIHVGNDLTKADCPIFTDDKGSMYTTGMLIAKSKRAQQIKEKQSQNDEDLIKASAAIQRLKDANILGEKVTSL